MSGNFPTMSYKLCLSLGATAFWGKKAESFAESFAIPLSMKLFDFYT